MTNNCSFKYSPFSRNVSEILKILAHSNICTMNKFFILLLLNIILPYTGFTQNPLLVKYNYETKILDKPFPFDQSFTVRITKIPDGWDSVTIKIREVKNLRKHVKKLSKSSPCITNEKLFGELKPKYKYTFNREQYCKGDSLEFTQLGYFAPNTDYVFDISPIGSRNLCENEKKDLVEHLNKSQITYKLVIKLIEEVTKNGEKSTNKILIQKFNEDLSEVIRMQNCNYQLKKMTNDESEKEKVRDLEDISSLKTSLINLNSQLEEIYHDDDYNISKRWELLSDFKKINPSYYETELDSYYKKWKEDSKITDTILDDTYLNDKYDNFKKDLKDVFEKTQDYVSHVVDQRVENSLPMIGTTYFNGSTENARTYLSFDAGYGANMATRDAFPYLGVNIYLRPIKREIPLKHYHGNLCDFFSSHFSFLVGMTTNSIESDPMRGGLIGNKAMLLGGGFRVLPWLKLNYGRMIYYDTPANPLVNRRYLTSDGFISASIDTDVVEIFKIFFK